MKLNTSKIAILLAAAFIFSLITISHVQAAPGDLDPSFGNGGKVITPITLIPFRTRIQSDGKIVTLGSYIYGEASFISRHNADGTLDTAFGSGGYVYYTDSEILYDFVIQPDGKFLAVGGKGPDLALCRYNSDGTRDTSFGINGVVTTHVNNSDYSEAFGIAIQSDSRIVATGYTDIPGEGRHLVIVRYDSSGTLDTTFGTNGLVVGSGATYGREILVQPDGKMIVNEKGTPSSNPSFIDRYNSNGTPDGSFGTNGKVNTGTQVNSSGVVYCGKMALQGDGKIVVNFKINESLSAIQRYNPNGSPDASFGTNGVLSIPEVDPPNGLTGGIASSLAIQQNGKILTAGDHNRTFALSRYNPNGTIDTSFGTNGVVITQFESNPDNKIINLALQPDGKIVAVGEVHTTTLFVALARYDGDPPPPHLTVTRSDDRNNATCVPGDCSLREAVNAANASPTDDTIDLASGLTTVTLTDEIVINNAGSLTINGPGANILTIDGGPGTNRLFLINSFATASISGVTLTGGNGTGGGIGGNGGAILVYGGELALEGVRVTGNTAASYGSGVCYLGGINGRIINSTISGNAGNTASSCGGGVSNLFGSMTIANTTISGNTSSGSGGGICISSSGGTYIALRNATITNNTAQRGGGIQNEVDYPGTSRLDLGNSIVAGNTASTGIAPEILTYPSADFITSSGGNLFGDSPGDSPNSGLGYQPTDIRDTNPRLGLLQNNGGTTATHALLGGSPLIDRGLNALVSPLASLFDQRGAGFARIRDGNHDGTATVDIGAFEVQPVTVTNLEDLYSAVNDPQNAGMHIVIAPGVYMLSVNDPGGTARPNSGRIELQENMSLQGVVGDRGAVVIDVSALPVSSFNNAPPIPLTGAIRMGRGTNSVEWLTIRNAVNAGASIETDLVSPGTAHIRIAHISSNGGQRGIDIRNFGAAMAGRVIEAEIVDNDLFNNRLGLGEGLRFVNNLGANGGMITGTISGNRGYNNNTGLLVENNRSNQGIITVVSSGDRFYENGLGALVGAGLSQSSTPANGNTVNFTATGTTYENNNGSSPFDRGGLVIIGGENTSIPNGTSDNTVNVVLRACRSVNNQLSDLTAIGARSNPVSVGLPGTNNHVKIRLYSTLIQNLVVADSIPDCPGCMNSVTVSRPSLDFDDDGKTDISVFRPSTAAWYVLRSSNGGFFASLFGVSTDKIAPADLDGDGKMDISVYRPSTGMWYWLNSSNDTFNAAHFGTAEDLPVPADYDGDGLANLAVFRPSNGTWYIVRPTGPPAQNFDAVPFGANGDKPTIGDFDGDGKADVAVFRSSNTAWYRLNSSNGAFVALSFGLSTDLITPADFDGDGKTDIAVYRPSSGTWYRLNSSNGAFNASQFGVAEDIPSAADFDGDGKADISVFRPSNGTWYRLNSSTGSFFAAQFGTNGDRPTPSAFRY